MNRVDDIIENVLYPGEGGEGRDLPKSHPRFKWTPPASKGPELPPSAGPGPGAGPEATPSSEEEKSEMELADDRTGSLSINQILGNRKPATKDDLWAASDRMRSKLGPAGAAKWAHDYGKAEFESLARQIVDNLL